MNKTLVALYEHYPDLRPLHEKISQAVALIIDCYEHGGKLLLCGNGGSAADCLHIVGELMKGFRLKRPLSKEEKAALLHAGAAVEMVEALQGALPAISLMGEIALVSAFGNDADSRYIYAQQVWGMGNKHDILMAISTSGNAQNVCCAAIAARAKSIKVIGLTGRDGGKLQPLCNTCIQVPAVETYRVQEYHLPVYHAICEMVENHFFSSMTGSVSSATV